MTDSKGLRHYNLASLSKETGIPARTIRFYISKKLLPPPKGGGRTASYGTNHLERLQEIQALKDKGLSLGDIQQRKIEVGPAKKGVVPLAGPIFVSQSLSPDVVVLVQTGTSASRQDLIQQHLIALGKALALESETK